METARSLPAPENIPGWRLIVSDTGRYWAIRNRAFPRVALRAGVEPAVDADTFEEVQAAVAEQEEKARTAIEGGAS
ncbi:hypothetical protein [Streptosporangium saharense]|uniref:Uncharacterized protein n=1 Tax=Streptosporangium saharense TaxID=1706840 RepID=A0A7W7QPI4_9ACTN|nr:hypothetical protein [Streptosporangium saharense]MBB4917224.1 hypothetical protein [Streptosporangium saharense]